MYFQDNLTINRAAYTPWYGTAVGLFVLFQISDESAEASKSTVNSDPEMSDGHDIREKLMQVTGRGEPPTGRAVEPPEMVQHVVISCYSRFHMYSCF